jgi:type III secretory pathway component EscS
MMSLGIYLSLVVMNKIGLMLATTITGVVGSLLGLLTSIYKEGLPDKPFALPIIVITAIVFLLASYICTYASQLCENDRAAVKGLNQQKLKNPINLPIILIVLLTTVLANGWSVGTASGTAAGFPPLLTTVYMATGSFISIFVVLGLKFTIFKEWKAVFCVGESKRPIILSMIAGSFHYGGNLISILNMPVISATISFLFGRTANIWTYLWGFYLKEFEGAKKKTLIFLVLGILLYFVGIGFLFIYNFS